MPMADELDRDRVARMIAGFARSLGLDKEVQRMLDGCGTLETGSQVAPFLDRVDGSC